MTRSSGSSAGLSPVRLFVRRTRILTVVLEIAVVQIAVEVEAEGTAQLLPVVAVVAEVAVAMQIAAVERLKRVGC